MGNELLPCPFCGGTAEIYNPFHVIGRPGRAATYRGGVRCGACGCESKATTPPDAAVTAWNRRALAAPQASEAVRNAALEVARAALMEIADLADVEADQRGVIVNRAMTKIDRMTAPQTDNPCQTSPVSSRACERGTKSCVVEHAQANKDGGGAETSMINPESRASAYGTVKRLHGLVEEAISWLETGGGRADSLCADLRKALAAQKQDIPANLTERLRHHAADKSNTAFARSTMTELAGYLDPQHPRTDGGGRG